MTVFTRDERLDLGRALVAIANGAEKLVRRCLDLPADAASFAVQHQALAIATRGSWRGSNAFRCLDEDIGLVLFSGTNHLRTVATILRSDMVLGTALATLTRGALEAFGRALWILSGDSPGDMLWRHACLAFDDLEYPSKIAPKERLERRGGEKHDADAFRLGIGEWAQNAELPKLKKVSQAQLVGDLVQGFDADWPDKTMGKQVYSDLSGVAHAQWFSIHSYVKEIHRDGRLYSMTLEASRDPVLEYVAMLYLGAVRSHEALAGYFNLPQAEAERWNAAKQIARESFERVHRPTESDEDGKAGAQ